MLAEQEAKNGKAGEYVLAANDTARFAAISFVKNKLNDVDDPTILKYIRREFPNFNCEQEVQWGVKKINHANRQASLTRSIILLCRGLAYCYGSSLELKYYSALDPHNMLDVGCQSEYIGTLRYSNIHDASMSMFDRAVGRKK